MRLTNTKRLLVFGLVCLILTFAAPLTMSLFADEAPAAAETLAATEAVEVAEVIEQTGDDGPKMYATIFSLLPPVVAIVLALITKEVYFSLFFGILCGALFAADFNPLKTVTIMFNDGFIAKLSSSGNVGILIFLVILGIMVSLMNKSGGSAAYGKWAQKKITSKKGALLSTFALGCLIFVDDYFNCLTVGSVMRPVTDTHKVSRAKLAYIIDATAAPICMIAPISSWAAAVTGVIEGGDGLELFIRSIPYNFYSLLTIVMIIVISLFDIDFGSMKKHEDNAANGDLYTTESRPYANMEEETPSSKGRVIDLILPVIVLIIACVLCIVYTGGFFDGGVSLFDAFSNCDVTVALPLGSFITLVFTFLLYVPRKVLSFKQFAESIPAGFVAMVPAILILSFAWTLSAMTNGMLGADIFVAEAIKGSASALTSLLPAIIFLVAIGLAFATGTSWGTFTILLPIVVDVLPAGSELLFVAISACLAGAVCGDHCSPISDTTIMASTGAQSDHINHVNTQLPYAMLVAALSFVGYILAGFVQMWFVVLPIMIIVIVAVLLVIKSMQKKKAN